MTGQLTSLRLMKSVTSAADDERVAAPAPSPPALCKQIFYLTHCFKPNSKAFHPPLLLTPRLLFNCHQISGFVSASYEILNFLQSAEIDREFATVHMYMLA